VVVGAHYDSAPGTPGADDNASGIAVTLALARSFAQNRPSRTVRFVAFTNEEPPYFWTENMGSLVYARSCRNRGEKIVAMLSIESVGFYSSAANSQHYPFGTSLLYPSIGDFVAFVGNLQSRSLVQQAANAFRRADALPSIGASLPNSVTGVGWSDHWSFWQQGFPGIEITDTAPYRNPYYHTPGDTPERLNYENLARCARGMRAVVGRLANPD
jgi:Zn-dependent M28 family amino/carboxypeptidase